MLREKVSVSEKLVPFRTLGGDKEGTKDTRERRNESQGEWEELWGN